MIKKLDKLIIKSFIGPFIVTFFIAFFVLMMQSLWKYIDDLVGKGLDFLTIGQFLWYASASLLMLAMPIAILISSIMTFGNLGESFELVAIKASGISLLRFMRPLMFISILLCGITFVFANLAGISTDGLPHFLFYLSGITAWNYFADCITKTSTVFKDNVNIFGKVYFPRLIMPLSIVVSNLVRFGVQFILFVAMMIYFAAKGAQFHVTYAIALVHLIIILMALLGLGIGLIMGGVWLVLKN